MMKLVASFFPLVAAEQVVLSTSTFEERTQIRLDGKDPTCKTGIRSLDIGEDMEQQVCCPTYCKECTDHPTCNAAFGANTKDSTDACCASKVAKAPENKSCDESLPPCKLTIVDFAKPRPNTAEEDCGNAREQMNDCLEAATKSPP